MKKAMILITALIAIGFMATQAFSWGPGRGMGGYGPGTNCPGIDRNTYNDLSKAQQDELAALRQKFIDDTYELRTSMMHKHNEIRLLMETSEPDRATLNRLTAEVSDIMKQIQENRIDFMLAAKKVAPELRFGGQGMGQGYHKGYGRGNCPGSGQGYAQGQNQYGGVKGSGCGRF
ncbi:MAG: periplasmic heavy metal sensor [Desulfotignum sp.]|nr:periplasmic heavy metal sensor [Desulfotignum sp.]MCF8112599.1 periplasmic heavy metal sensor [Desulfotignum sp.]MCF8124939.1 periplasmic heavy metal sensor [Desulfotignum sp.]